MILAIDGNPPMGIWNTDSENCWKKDTLLQEN